MCRHTIPRMRMLTQLSLLVALTLPTLAPAQMADQTIRTPNASGVSFEALSDTRGVQLNSYLGQLAHELRQHLTTNTASHQPVDLLLTINGQGKLVALQLASADTPASKAAWNAVKDLHYAPLPTGLSDTSLKLKVHLNAL